MTHFEFDTCDKLTDKEKENLKLKYQLLELAITDILSEGRVKTLALTALRESYLYTVKSLKEDKFQPLKSIENTDL